MKEYLKIAFYAAIFLAGCTVTSWYYGKEIADIKRKAAEDRAEAIQEAREDEQAKQKRINDALAEASKRADKYKKLAADLDGNVDSVRLELAQARADLSQASADAVRRYSDAQSNVVRACTARLVEVGVAATQCASDLRLMQEAWPD